MITIIKDYLLDLQNRICQFIETEDGTAKFFEDPWQHHAGGGGLTRVIANGPVVEKGGVNFSHVHGAQLPAAATAKRPELTNMPFQALGVSVVIHPVNPFAPTCHLNVRFISVEKKDGEPHWWFGGGFDLTPYYGFDEDCIHWHTQAKNACDVLDKDAYPKFKKWADDYFYLKHRNEPRGIGGIFYDDVNQYDFDKCFAFMRAVGDHFILAYQPLLAKRKHQSFTEAEKAFQHYRRGRYVEFNLLYDRGTYFGLQSGGRTESILMSLPPVVNWRYDWKPKADTQEAALYNNYLTPKEWI